MTETNQRTVPRPMILACGVFEHELAALAAEAPDGFAYRLLDAGLHNRPAELRIRLQEAIDSCRPAEVSRIGLLYGLCGRGAVGLLAREVPLLLPRTHDCIALFLGSRATWHQQFRQCPGTMYVTPGWFEKKTHPDSLRFAGLQRRQEATEHPRYAEWAATYGDANAAFIVEFHESWRGHYQRVAFINNDLGDIERYREYTRNLAAASRWRFEEVPGGLDFIRRLILAEPGDDDLLVVPPGHRIVATNDQRVAVALSPADDRSAVTPIVATGTFVISDEPETAPAASAAPSLGLGIDAGGTYTDAVVLDLTSGQVLSWAKAPTTPLDLSVGIAEALDGLDPALLPAVNISSVSTTLATNAIVEDRGAQVGLLLMPVTPAALAAIEVDHARVIPGRLSVDGEELAPLEVAPILRAARELIEAGVEAFAVSGYGAVRNPSHEQAVQRLLGELGDYPVVCGHHLSGELDFVRRAHTAVLNARLLPVVADLLTAVDRVLAERQVTAPRYVVRGDGSLIAMEVALERPIETVLSGPAASVVGARFLTGRDDLLVVDIGGTTTDVAAVEQGQVTVRPDGAAVGRWRTSVQAADVLTSGLGGDSHIRLTEGQSQLAVGPQRATPLSWLSSREPDVLAHLRALSDEPREEPLDTRRIEFYRLDRPRAGLSTGEREERLLAALADGPLSRDALVAATGVMSANLLPTARLEQLGVIRRVAFTATDALHVTGGFTGYDGAAAHLAAALLGSACGRTGEAFAAWAVETFVDLLAAEIVRREVSLDEPELLLREDDRLLDRLLIRLRREQPAGSARYQLAYVQQRPVVGVGAPAACFLPAACERLQGEAVIPPHAQVANAVGAVGGKVRLHEQLSVRTDAAGGFLVVGRLGRWELEDLASAREHAVGVLVDHLRVAASRCGTDRREVTVAVAERSGLLSDGSRQLLELVVEGWIEGRPRGDQGWREAAGS